EEGQGGPLTGSCHAQHLHLVHVLSTANCAYSSLEINNKGITMLFSLLWINSKSHFQSN
ncbi:unnamed protein product, partial [Hymenolepis diminuta]